MKGHERRERRRNSFATAIRTPGATTAASPRQVRSLGAGAQMMLGEFG